MPHLYCYQALSTPRCIRVLELAPALSRAAPIRYKLTEVDLDRKPPARLMYEALSYVWGHPKGDRPTLCEGHQLLITMNCEEALRELRFRVKTRILWIDAICINQSDIPERNLQVAMMDSVYQQAAGVLVWLGPTEGINRSGFNLYLQTTYLEYLLWRLNNLGLFVRDGWWSRVPQLFLRRLSTYVFRFRTMLESKL